MVMPGRLDMLKLAGIEHARIMLVALDSEEEGLRVAEVVRQHYPKVRLVVRGHNRFSQQLYRQKGVSTIVRELMGSSLEAAGLVLQELGFSESESGNLVQIFERHDRQVLEKSAELDNEMGTMIEHNLHSREMLASLFLQDQEEISDPH